MDENSHRKWDILLKAIGAASIAIGGVFGLWQYRDTTEKEFRKPFWEKQIDVYFEVSKAAATIATLDETNTEKKKETEDEFWKLYWGQVVLVEDKPVKDAMQRFSQCLKGEDEYCRSDDELKKEELQKLSLELANSCRSSISNSWDIDLKNLYIQENKVKLP
jgi:hypothetical protein